MSNRFLKKRCQYCGKWFDLEHASQLNCPECKEKLKYKYKRVKKHAKKRN